MDRQAYLFYFNGALLWTIFGRSFRLLSFRTIGPSDNWTIIGLSDYRAFGLLDFHWVFGLSGFRTIGPSGYRAFVLSGLRTIGPSDYRADTVYTMHTSLKIAMIIYRCIKNSTGMMLTNKFEHYMQQWNYIKIRQTKTKS